MKKILISTALVISFIAFSIKERLSAQTNVPDVLPGSNINTSPTTNSDTNTNDGAHMGVTNATTMMSSYKNGTYTGSVADAFYGNLQVRVVIRRGKVSDVQFLQYPNDRPNSVAISQYMMPQLRSEAIQVQSAQVDTVSGATASSAAFVQSLQSALDQAHA